MHLALELLYREGSKKPKHTIKRMINFTIPPRFVYNFKNIFLFLKTKNDTIKK